MWAKIYKDSRYARAIFARLFTTQVCKHALGVTTCKTLRGLVQVRVAVGGQSKRTAEAEGRENLDWEETMVRAMCCMAT